MALLAAQYNRRGGVAPKPVYSPDPEDGDHDDDWYAKQRAGRGADQQRASTSGSSPSNDSPEIHGI